MAKFNDTAVVSTSDIEARIAAAEASLNSLRSQLQDAVTNGGYAKVTSGLPIFDRKFSISGSRDERRLVIRPEGGKAWAANTAEEVDQVIAALQRAKGLTFNPFA